MAEDLCDTKLRLAIGGGYLSPATKTLHQRELKPLVGLHLWFPSCRNEEEEGEIEKKESKNLEKHKTNEKDEDRDNNHSMRKKLCLTKDQSTLLEESFCFNSSLTTIQKQELAQKLALRPRQVEVWFQNRRARTKMKQIEADCEALKRWCISLTDENKRLKRELHEVRLHESKVEEMGDCQSSEKKARVLQLES